MNDLRDLFSFSRLGIAIASTPNSALAKEALMALANFREDSDSGSSNMNDNESNNKNVKNGRWTMEEHRLFLKGEK